MGQPDSLLYIDVLTYIVKVSERMDLILNAAYACLRRSGVRRTTMDDIAKELGISRTLLYRDVRSTDDAFRKLAQRFLAEALAASRGAIEADGPLTPRITGALLVKLNLAYRVTTDAPEHAAELLGEHARISADLTAAYLADLQQLLAGAFREFPSSDARDAAEILLCLTLSLESHGDRDHAARVLARGVDLTIAGLIAGTERNPA